MKKCVFAGTFDPVTCGHVQIILDALKSYDKVIVGIGINDQKTPAFTVEDRINLIKKVFDGDDRVEVLFYQGYTVDFIKRVGADTIIRGIRNDQDLSYENLMKDFNTSKFPELKTVFIKSSKENLNISSSLVKDNLKNGLSVKGLVPQSIIDDVIRLYSKKA